MKITRRESLRATIGAAFAYLFLPRISWASERIAKWIKFELLFDLNASSDPIVKLLLCWDGREPVGDEVYVRNTHGFTGDTGACGFAVRCDDGSYEITILEILNDIPRILDWDLGGNQEGRLATIHLDGVEIPHVLQIDTVAITVRWLVHDKSDEPVWTDETKTDLLRETLTGHTVSVLFADGTRMSASKK